MNMVFFHIYLYIIFSSYVPGTVLSSMKITERKINRYDHGTHGLVRVVVIN